MRICTHLLHQRTCFHCFFVMPMACIWQALLREFAFSFELHAWGWQLKALATNLVRDFPEQLFILNHSGLPHDTSDKGVQEWKVRIRHR